MPLITKPLLQVLSGIRVSPPPIWLMRQAGRFLPEYRALRAAGGSFLDFCFSPQSAAEATMQPIRRFGLDAAILFSDILVIPFALGQPLRFAESGGPKLEPLRSAAAIDALRHDRLLETLSPVFETVDRVKAMLPEQVALIGFAGGPWTVACYMVEGGGSADFSATRLFAYQEPEAFGRLIALIVDATVEYLAAQIEHGAEAVQIFDSWAGILPDAEFQSWVIEPTRLIVARLKAIWPHIPIIGFPRNAGTRYWNYKSETCVDALSLDTTVTPELACEYLGSSLPLQGNLDPIALLAGEEILDGSIDSILDGFRNSPHIFNLGHGVLPQTPPEHVTRLVARIRGSHIHD